MVIVSINVYRKKIEDSLKFERFEGQDQNISQNRDRITVPGMAHIRQANINFISLLQWEEG